MSKLRCLRPAAALALNVCPEPGLQLTTLLPVTHVLLDLHAKLQLLVAKARRPAGFAAPAATPAPLPQGLNGMVAMGRLVCNAATAGPPCLQGTSLQQLVEQVVVRECPALQRHLCTALTVIRQPPADDREELFKGKDLYGQKCLSNDMRMRRTRHTEHCRVCSLAGRRSMLQFAGRCSAMHFCCFH